MFKTERLYYIIT